MADNPLSNSPAYLSYTTFKSAIQGLALDGPLPRQIDRTVLPNLSGSGRKMFLAALKFFGLIDESSAPSERLKKLAKATDSDWKEYLSVLLKEKYPALVDMLSDGSPKLIREKFEEHFTEIGPSTVTPAVRFFISAARDAGVPVSHHLVQRQVPASAGPRKKLKKNPRQAISNEDLPAQHEEQANSIEQALLNKFPNFDPSWSPEQQKAWFSAYEKLLSMTQGPEAKRAG